MSETKATSKVIDGLLGMEASRPQVVLTETSFDELIQNAKFLESLFPSWVFVLCKLQHAEVQYVSENAQAMLGYPAEYIKELTLSEFYGHVHPDDAKGVRLVLEYLFDWAKQNPGMDPKHHRIGLHYRLSMPNRTYIHVLEEKRAYQNPSGYYTHFSLFKNASEKQMYTGVRLEISKLIDGDYRKIDEFVPKTNTSAITSREKEILLCIREGLTSKQIANKLSISVFTVRNHRSNIFEKAGAQNMVQLIQHAEAAGWI